MIAAGDLGISARFNVLRRLGDGGMGIVYEAIDKRRNTRVALKTLSRAEPESIYYLKNEFRALADVVHPNLVGLHELFAEGDTWFFTMDLVDGVSFVQHVRDTAEDTFAPTFTVMPDTDLSARGMHGTGSSKNPASQVVFGRLNPVEVRRAMQQLVNGVEAIHDAGKLHRDLKPSNVLVTRDGRVKILDFGLVSDATPGSIGDTVGGLAGTPAYMSPEQARGGRATAESDWYAVGVMLYESLTGRLPFAGTMYEVLNAKQQRTPVRPLEVDPAVPEDLDQLCMALLRVTPNERPRGPEVLMRLVPATVASLHVVTDTGHRSGPRHLTPPPFVGRREHLSELEAALDDAESGKPVVVQLHGLSGMGKSSLLRQFADTAEHGRGALVLQGRCYERESVPFKGIDGIIDAITRHMRRLPLVEAARLLPRNIHALARLFPVLQRLEAVVSAPHRRALPPDPTELRRRAIAALGELLTRLNDETPVVLCVDDFQWADTDSAVLFRELLTLPEPPPCLLVVAYRSDEAERSEALTTFSMGLAEAVVDVRSVEVGGLDKEEIIALTEGLSQQSRLDAHRLWLESQGNPYFVRELIHRALDESDDDAPISSTRLSLDDALRARVSRLGEDARRLLELLAVAGRPTPRSVFRAALTLPDEANTVRELRAASFVRTSGDELIECYHDRVREAVVDGLAPEKLRGLHARIAPVLEHHRADPQAVAEHYRAAGQTEKAFDYALLGAQRAGEALAFERAAQYYSMAIELAPTDSGSELIDLQRKLAEVLAYAGRSLAAANAYEAAASAAEASEAARLRSLAAAQKLLAGHVEEGIAGLKVSLAAYGLSVPDGMWEQESLRAEKARACRRKIAEFVASPSWRSDAELSYEERIRLDVTSAGTLGLYGLDMSPLLHLIAAETLLSSVEAREPVRCLKALSLSASLVRAAGVQPKPEYLRMMALAEERMQSPLAKAWGRFNEGCAAYWQTDLSAALVAFKDAEQIFSTECHGVSREIAMVRHKLALLMKLVGAVKEQLTACDDWARAARERGDFFTEFWMDLLSPKNICLDDIDAARRETELIQAKLTRLGGLDFSQSIVAVAEMTAVATLTEIDWYAGEPIAAWSRIESFFERWQSIPGISAVSLHRMICFILRARALAGVMGVGLDTSDVRAKVASVLDELRSNANPIASSYACVLMAAAAKQAGSLAQADRHLSEGAERVERASAMTHRCIKRQLGKLRDGDEGRRLVQMADDALREEGIVSPERWANMVIPGF